jgi:hypothetical protein
LGGGGVEAHDPKPQTLNLEQGGDASKRLPVPPPDEELAGLRRQVEAQAKALDGACSMADLKVP